MAAADEGPASVGAAAGLGPRRLRRAAALNVLDDVEAAWWAFRAHASLFFAAARESPNASWKPVSTVDLSKTIVAWFPSPPPENQVSPPKPS